ncbi:hypothetical protein C2W62_36590, partial [Candidatus Entotheonella serta]
GGKYVRLGLHAKRCIVMLVQHDAVNADFFDEFILFNIIVIEFTEGFDMADLVEAKVLLDGLRK